MSYLLKLFIVVAYIFLVYKYHKNTTLLLLFTLATILVLCNINKVEGFDGKFGDTYASPEFKSLNNIDKVDIYDKSKSGAPEEKAKPKEVQGVDEMDSNNIVIPQAVFTKYQMGPFDNLSLTTGNPLSEYLRLVSNTLSSSDELCVYQGNENPLKCKKTTGLNIGPTVDGKSGSPKSMFMFKNNKSSPNCCPSTFSTSAGCVCTTEEQRKFVNSRGIGEAAPKGVDKEGAASGVLGGSPL